MWVIKIAKKRERERDRNFNWNVFLNYLLIKDAKWIRKLEEEEEKSAAESTLYLKLII